MKLGRLPHDPTRASLALGPRLDTAVLPNPVTVDWLSQVGTWPMYGNSEWGDCVWAMAGHALEAWSTYGAGATVTVTEQAVLKGYSDVTGFNPNDPNTDQGTVIQDALDYWRKTGIGGHKILAFAKVDVSKPDQVKAALNVFGALLVGIDFPAVAMDQFNAGKPWDAVSQDGGIEGGHAIHVGHDDTSTTRYRLTTWGAVQGMTQAFWDRYVSEAWVAISPEWLDVNGHNPEGLDLYGLGDDFAALTGKPNPFPKPAPTPTPVPVPPPVADADHTLAAALRPWVTQHHVGSNHLVQVAAQRWLAAKHLE